MNGASIFSSNSTSNKIISDGSNQTNSFLGGVIGLSTGSISQCYSIQDEISVKGNPISSEIGGITGKIQTGTLTNCSTFNGMFLSFSINTSIIGAIVGTSDVSLSNCESKNNIISSFNASTSRVGGIVGTGNANMNTLISFNNTITASNTSDSFCGA